MSIRVGNCCCWQLTGTPVCALMHPSGVALELLVVCKSSLASCRASWEVACPGPIGDADNSSNRDDDLAGPAQNEVIYFSPAFITWFFLNIPLGKVLWWTLTSNPWIQEQDNCTDSTWAHELRAAYLQMINILSPFMILLSLTWWMSHTHCPAAPAPPKKPPEKEKEQENLNSSKFRDNNLNL
jgi:hypothetical protein